MNSPKQIIQLAKDVTASSLFIISSGLSWWYTIKLIAAGVILALVVDVATIILAIVELKITLADVKDFIGIFSLISLLTFTIIIDDLNKYRLVYCILFAALGLFDAFCVLMHLTNYIPLYNSIIWEPKKLTGQNNNDELER